MTSQRAIEVLEYSKGYDGMDCGAPKIALDMAIQALETIDKIKYIVNEKTYRDAHECDYGNGYTCENALMINDITELLETLS